MKIFKRGERWCVDAKFGEQHAKEAGFEWDAKQSLWWTCDARKAWQLREFADNSVKNAIHKEFLKHKRNGHHVPSYSGLDKSRAMESAIHVPAPDGLKYLPYQLAGIEFALERQHTLIADEMGLGKAQPLDAKILTPHGWKTMGDMKVGMQVTGKDGKATEVLGVFPQGKKDVYEVTFTDGSKVRCCGDHLWTVNTPTRRFRNLPWFDLTTKQLIQNGLTYEATGKRKFHVPLVGSVQYKKQRDPLPVDPWLLGIILGGSSHIRPEVVITVSNDAIKARIEETLARNYGGEIVLSPQLKDQNKEHRRWRIKRWKRGGVNVVVSQLRELGIQGLRADERFIPDMYLRASIRERIELLRGLLDARGSGQNGLRFVISSAELREGIRELVGSLGGCTNAVDGHQKNFMALKLPTKLGSIFTDPNKCKVKHRRNPTRTIDKIEKVGNEECQCISVSNKDGLYVSNDYAVTHNTIQAIGVMNATKT